MWIVCLILLLLLFYLIINIVYAIIPLSLYIGRVFYGQNEWQRLFQPAEVDEDERIVRFRTELGLSDTMAQTCDVVFAMKPFPVRDSHRFFIGVFLGSGVFYDGVPWMCIDGRDAA